MLKTLQVMKMKGRLTASRQKLKLKQAVHVQVAEMQAEAVLREQVVKDVVHQALVAADAGREEDKKVTSWYSQQSTKKILCQQQL